LKIRYSGCQCWLPRAEKKHSSTTAVFEKRSRYKKAINLIPFFNSTKSNWTKGN
jgi:hypothetical protein